MSKSAFIAGVLVNQSASAMDEKYTCDEASMTKMEADMNA